MTATEPDLGTAWCPECRRRVQVEDRHMESAYVGGSAMAWEQHYLAEDLACGHSNTYDRGRTNTAPGGGSGELPRAYTLGLRDPWADEA